MLCLMGVSGCECVVRLQKEGSYSYLSLEQEQRNTGRTLVQTPSSGIQDDVCWRNRTDTPPDRMIKQTKKQCFMGIMCHFFPVTSWSLTIILFSYYTDETN